MQAKNPYTEELRRKVCLAEGVASQDIENSSAEHSRNKQVFPEQHSGYMGLGYSPSIPMNKDQAMVKDIAPVSGVADTAQTNVFQKRKKVKDIILAKNKSEKGRSADGAIVRRQEGRKGQVIKNNSDSDDDNLRWACAK